MNYLLRITYPDDGFSWKWVSREVGEKLGPTRLAKLRNYGVSIADTDWIAFLDDDNEFEPNHLSSLVACAKQNQCRVAHSHMQIFWPDGSVYLEPKLPWSRNLEEASRLYLLLCAKGVFQPGSNIVRDRIDPWDHPDPVRTSDTGEWLFERTLLLEYPFCTEYDGEDWLNVTTEDDKLMRLLVENRITIACTQMPTLKYYLGGYSNEFNSTEVTWESETI